MMKKEFGIKANLSVSRTTASKGALCWILRLNPGGGNDRIVVLLRSRGGRWIEIWMNRRHLTNFRGAWVPEHLRNESLRSKYPIIDDYILFETKADADKWCKDFRISFMWRGGGDPGAPIRAFFKEHKEEMDAIWGKKIKKMWRKFAEMQAK